jgi:PhzF family phenazine biosynthesis protein
MDTREVLLVDAFADGPMTGTPVGVVLDAADLADDQQAAIADEFGAPGTAFVSETDEGWSLRVAGDREVGRGIHVAIAAASALDERGRLAGDSVTFDLEDRTVAVTIEDDGRAWVTVDRPDLREAETTEDEVAEALGLDVAAIRDVGADLPLVRASLGPGVLLVPVNFLEHLSGADPDLSAVAALLEQTGSEAIYAYTFDTLSRDAEIHGLLVGREGPRDRTGGEAAAIAAVAARRYGAFDHDRTALRIEQGDLQDRPARLAVRTDLEDAAEGVGDDPIAVGGRTVTVLQGTVVVPPASESDDIIEV